MAIRAKHFCAHPGCNELTASRYCPMHQPAEYTDTARAYDARRGSAAQRGYDARWNRFSKRYLAHPDHQFCALHISARCAGRAQCVDHIRPLAGPDDPGRFDPENLQPACLACNTAKGNRTLLGSYVFGKQPGPVSR